MIEGSVTLAVVFDHVLNASAAASIASFVSTTPISGTVPRLSSLAGSTRVLDRSQSEGAQVDRNMCSSPKHSRARETHS